MGREYQIAAGLVWLIWYAIWLAVGLTARTNLVREPFRERAPHFALLLSSIVLVFGFQLLPLGSSDFVRCVFIVLILPGLAVASWARYHLGRNWSGLVVLKQGHELVHSGPYRYVRHPIYTGLILAMLSTAVSVNTLSAFVGALLWFLTFAIKARHEERLLGIAFGDRYAWLCRNVPSRLIPGVF